MKRKLTVFFLLFVAAMPLRALPIELVKDWEYTYSRNLFSDRTQWSKLDSLPYREDQRPLDFTDGVAFLGLRKNILITDEDLQSLGSDRLSLHIPYIASYYEVYWNGKQIHTCGRIVGQKIERACIWRHLVLPLDSREVKIGENQLTVLTAAEKGWNIGITPTGNREIINLDRYAAHLNILSERITLMLGFLYFFMGLYHGLFYIKRRKESYNLYYALFSLFLAVYIYTRTNAVFELDLEGILLKRIEFSVLFVIPAFLIFFLEKFFLNRLSIPSKIYFALVCTLAFGTSFLPANYLVTFLRTWQYTMFYVVGHIITVCAIAMKRKIPDVKRLLLGVAALLIAGSWDVLGAMGVAGIQNLGLTRYGFFLFVSGIAFILANKFLRVQKQVEELNEQLEKKVEERTEDLRVSLEEIKKLKIQQDGDYFLTSLLINPLSRSSIESHFDYYTIQHYSRQKKEFEFRGRKMEIGGDINIVDHLRLQGKDYIVFVNADAMGKSIQGAGGALVLGVIFHAMLERTKQRKDYSSKPPESWIKECYLELQTVFETFDGSMLASLVMGLLQVKSGFLFFINSEHPRTVLYRNGKASFLEYDVELRKIGTKGLISELKVQTFQMEPKDIFFAGSDGRDDLLLGYNEKGDRIINEDESLFLRCIEEARGDLESTVENILKIGDLTDDISLIRIEFNPDSEAFHAQRTSEEKRKKQLLSDGMASLKEKDYAAASRSFSYIADNYPDHTESYYLASYCLKKLRNFTEAVNYGERLFLRVPDHLNNLLNLADTHYYLQNYSRVNMLLKKAESIQPDHPAARKIREKLDALTEMAS
jgi:hypothetical protein